MNKYFRMGVLIGALVLPTIARADCFDNFFSPQPDLFYNNPALIDPHESRLTFSMSRPYWVVLAGQKWLASENSDYDVAFYQSWTGGVFPVCLSGLLAASAGTNSTDFVIGDFNHNPYGNYYARVNCYSGPCSAVNVQYRDGGTVLTVNSAGITASSAPSSGNKNLIRVYDVYLNAGTHYYFNFRTTGALQQKMLLFRNAGNGVYWAGRNQAVFATSGCTPYDAPSSGYYGLVVVADGDPGLVAGTFSVSVTTQSICSCPAVLASDVPVQTVAGPAIDYRLAIQNFAHWSTVGLRSNSDWDIQVATLARDFPNVNCPNVQLGGSYQASDPVEVVVSDGNHISLPDTLQITSATFVGNQAATIELNRGPEDAPSDGWKFAGSLGSDDVATVWDVPLLVGEAYGLKLQSFGTSARAMLFRNPSNSRYVAGRIDAVVSTQDTATYVAPQAGTYGLVLLHEDAAVGGVLLEAGSCKLAPALVEGSFPVVWQNLFTSIIPTAASWGVASVLGNGLDYDIQLYGSSQGTGYPDCYSDPSAASNGAGPSTEIVVADLSSAPLDTTYARFYGFAMNPAGAARVEWSQARVSVAVNGAIVADDMSEHIAVVHEVRLAAGATAQIQFVPAPSGNQRVLLFGHSGSGAYWAPRSAALAQTNSVVSFTPPYTGSYALVVLNEDLNSLGTTYLSVTDGVTGAPIPGAPRTTRLASAGPNPSRGSLELSYELAEPADLTFELVDVTGRVASRLHLGHRGVGPGQAQWMLSGSNGGAATAGVYFVRMTAGARAVVGTRRVSLMR